MSNRGYDVVVDVDEEVRLKAVIHSSNTELCLTFLSPRATLVTPTSKKT